MKTNPIVLFALGLALAAMTVLAAPAYRIAARLTPGGDGGWDYLTVDAANHRLFVSRATRVQVVDLATGKLSAEIPGTDGVHGIALAPEFGSGFTSNGRAGTVTVFDLETLKATRTIDLGTKNPDAILYEPVSKRVFTFNGGSSNATAIDAKTLALPGTVPLPGKPEFAVADGSGRVFVNIEDKAVVVKFDASSLKVEATIPLTGCEEPTGLAIDAASGFLFSGCSNEIAAVVNLKTGKVVANLPVGAHVDGVAFDPSSKCAFVSAGSGVLTVIRETGHGLFVTNDVTTEPGARTIAIDEATHKLYLPTAEHPRSTDPAKPQNFRILVLEPAP